MRIVLIGQAAFGEKVLQTLVERGEQVVGVYAPPDTPGRTNSLKEVALKLNIPTFQPKGMRSPATYDQYAGLKPDLTVMAFVTDIVPETILNCARLGTIQYHPSLLPKHRGGSAINWAIINGETKTGITIFWPDRGIDTGPILMQKETEIAADDTVGSLYFNKLFPLGVEALAESVDLVSKGKAPRIQQNEAKASYEGLCSDKDAVINWSGPSGKVYDLIRGTNPQPGATTHFRGRPLKIFDSKPIPDIVGGLHGQIIDRTADGFVVALKHGAILVKKVQAEKSPKIGAAEFASQVGLKIGDRVGE